MSSSNENNRMITRNARTLAAKTAFQVLILDLCEQDADGPIHQGLMELIGEEDIRSIMVIQNSDLNEMVYTEYKNEDDTVGITKIVVKSQIALVKAAIQYIRYKDIIDLPLNTSWSNVDTDDWDTFRMKIYCPDLP